MQNYHVYMLRCGDGSYYVGHTTCIEQRILAHKEGGYSQYTSKRLPVELVYVEMCGTQSEAFRMERQIKGWSRKKKEALIRGDWAEIKRLSNAKEAANVN